MIKIIAVGKLKEQYLKDLCEDYLKRINKHHKTIIVEVKDENSLAKERDNILKYIDEDELIIILDKDGKDKCNSKEFAERMDGFFSYHHISKIAFIIGGSDGLHDDIKYHSHAKFHLSFSNLTFPHGLFRGVLLEQIYRSFKINNNETYHK